jgi:hypothetical protein
MESISTLSFVLYLLPLISFTSFPKTSGARITVNETRAEIDKLAARFKNIEKPSPAMVNSLVDQLRESCRVNKTLEEDVVVNTVNFLWVNLQH